MKSLRTLAAVVALAGGLTAQIDVNEYFPLGSFNAWEMIDRAAFDADGSKAEHQIMSVTKTDVVDGVTQYNVRTKLFQDVPNVLFRFGKDGDQLFLYGVRILLPTEFINDDDIKVSLPTVFFDEPVPIGGPATALGVTNTFPVTAKFVVKLKIGSFLDESGTIFIGPNQLNQAQNSTVSVTWNSFPPVNTPLGLLGAAEGPNPALAQLVIDFSFYYSSNNDDINDELVGQNTDKAVGGVMGPGLGFVLIDGQGGQQKILNRAVLPGDLVFNPADLDAFPPLPEHELEDLVVPLTTGVAIISFSNPIEGDVITDGTVSMGNIQLEHDLNGNIAMTADVSAGAFGPAPVKFKGKTKFKVKTGELKVGINGKTKMLSEFSKALKFKVREAIPLVAPPAEGTAMLTVEYKGKDPLTKEKIEGSLELPIAMFQPTQATLDIANSGQPVDLPKIKKAVLQVKDTKRRLASEGTLTLTEAAEGTAMVVPITVREAAKLKEGFPTKRVYSVQQTGKKRKFFRFAGETDTTFTLLKFVGNLTRTKIKPDVASIIVQPVAPP